MVNHASLDSADTPTDGGLVPASNINAQAEGGPVRVSDTSPIQVTEATEPAIGCADVIGGDFHESPIPLGNKPDAPVGDENVTVCQLRSASQYSIQIMVSGSIVDAVVDTAAEVTIISDRFYRSLKKPPAKVRDVKLLTAGRQMSMMGFIVGPTELKIGDKVFSEFVYVAPIEQDMLLGFDILVSRGAAILDMGAGMLTFAGQRIQMKVGGKSGIPSVARVTVAKRQVIAPHSVGRLQCSVSSDMSEYVLEGDAALKVLIPRTVCESSKPIISVLNVSDKYRLLKKGMSIAQAYPFDEVVKDASVGVSNVNLDEGKVEESLLPDHLKAMFESSKSGLDPVQSALLKDVLVEFQDVFALNEFDLGSFTDIEHEIDTGTALPNKERMRRTPACFANEEEAHLQKMISAGVIQPSASDWASAPVLIRKRDGTVRWCIDYRQLNNVTVKDVFPLPLVDDCLDTLSGNTWFSKLDANSAYWQVNIREQDRRKTAFVTKYGLYEHIKMGFGLCNAPATYARIMNLVMRGLNWKIVLAFLDDILVMGKTFDEHLANLKSCLERFRRYGLKLKPKKCVFFQRKVEFLGRVVTGDSLCMSDKDTAVVDTWPVPKSSKDVERFMGLANYHRSFVKDFSRIAEPLYSVVGKKKFMWGEPQATAFIALKELLTHPPVLALPNQLDEFILDTDASNFSVGGELIQVQNGEEKVIAYGSFSLTKEQRNYCVTRKELLAVVRFTRQYKYYLLGRPFTVRTDHSSLTWLLNFKEPQGQLARWMEELSQYNMILRHRAGSKHDNADALSRRPDAVPYCNEYIAGATLRDLPCRGCKYCVRAEEQWGDFVNVVDEAVPLTSHPGNTPVEIRSSSDRVDLLQGECLDTPCTNHNVQLAFDCRMATQGRSPSLRVCLLLRRIQIRAG